MPHIIYQHLNIILIIIVTIKNNKKIIKIDYYSHYKQYH